MSERDDLLVSVTDEIRTYRKGDLPEPTPEHVDRWLSQFTPDQQLPFLREFDHVIRHTFITRKNIKGFIRHLVSNEKLAGKNPTAYWSSANFLDIQQNGHSQKEMLKLFSKCLEEECGLDLDDCGEDGGDFIYLDDVLFSGNRIGNDLEPWIVNEAPQAAKIHVIVAACHTLGNYLVERKLKGVIERSGKKITILFWRALTVENQKAHKNSSEVLWPTAIPNVAEVQAYMALPSKYPFEPRQPSTKPIKPFLSEAGRQILESEFLIAGAKIRAKSENPKPSIRPLGFSPFGLGFGSMIATYRNCPNNCPLAMWWGDPEATSGALHWYPLLQRETY
ncbi:hypothetical protein CXP47_07195 [Pseudomonas chlororaphis]|uniref:PRTase-CE domain-containing protein n=1 Tax=Pseudomonas chlororaphis TaxID=587753 RepID=A0AAQ0AQZ7_9PSED|nr:hypothetical protein [Pseudomonas chlororaphis]AUG39676.1 hypothetical protein CXP47_07195 [Pseudomonas chlororaphis]QNR49270.1 hypothetical protein HLB40_07125 [Pseudomonas chlororaphis]